MPLISSVLTPSYISSIFASNLWFSGLPGGKLAVGAHHTKAGSSSWGGVGEGGWREGGSGDAFILLPSRKGHLRLQSEAGGWIQMLESTTKVWDLGSECQTRHMWPGLASDPAPRTPGAKPPLENTRSSSLKWRPCCLFQAFPSCNGRDHPYTHSTRLDPLPSSSSPALT